MKIYIFSLEKSVQCQQRLTFHLPSITKHCSSITSQTLMKHFTVSSLPLQVLTASANLVAHSLQLKGADSSSASSCLIFEGAGSTFTSWGQWVPTLAAMKADIAIKERQGYPMEGVLMDACSVFQIKAFYQSFLILDQRCYAASAQG